MHDDPIAEALVDGAQQYVDAALAPLLDRIAALRAEVTELRALLAAKPDHDAIGAMRVELALHGERSKAMAEQARPMLQDMVDRAVAALPPARDGKDADPEFVRSLVAELGASLPPGPQGPPGPPGAVDVEAIDRIIADKVAALPPAQAGRDADPEEIARQVAAAVAALPPAERGPQGEPGREGAPGERGEAGERGAVGPEGPVGPPGAEGKEGPAGRDGRDGQPGVPGRDGADGLPGANGADGRDGLGFDDMTVEHDGGRTVTLRFVRGELVKAFPIKLTVPLYRGVFAEGAEYERGDCVTFGGSLWHANVDTAERPGDASKSWVLMAKRGRDGKNGERGERGLQGPAGKDAQSPWSGR